MVQKSVASVFKVETLKHVNVFILLLSAVKEDGMWMMLYQMVLMPLQAAAFLIRLTAELGREEVIQALCDKSGEILLEKDKFIFIRKEEEQFFSQKLLLWPVSGQMLEVENHFYLKRI